MQIEMNGIASARDGAPATTPNSELRTPNCLSLICRFSEIPSTNTLCAHLLEEFRDVPELLPTGLIFADRQTAGRGRGDHAWTSPAGGLYFSVFFRAEPVPGFLPLTTGLFLARWIGSEFGLPVRVRWPNDLLLEGRKLGGILCESKNGTCIIGVGLNVNTPVVQKPGALQPSAVMGEVLGRRVDLEILRAQVEAAVSADLISFVLDDRNLMLWESLSAFSPGQALRWKVGGRSGQGRYLGITSEGFLKVESGGAVLELASAEDVLPA